MARWVLPMIVVAAVVAGCAGDSGPSGVVANVGEEGDGTTGAVVGRVTTDEIVPIEGATVGVVESPASVVATDEGGAYRIDGLAPGSYVVAAAALGFESSGQRVSVVADGTAEANFVLSALPSPDPYIETDIRRTSQRAVVFKLTPQCIHTDVNPLVTTCNGIRFACQPSGNCEVHYEDVLEASPPWATIVGEVQWEPQSAASGKAFLFDINAPNITRGFGGSIVQNDPYTFSRMTPDPPIIIRIDNPTTLEERGIAQEDRCCDWFYRLFTGWCDLGSFVGNCETTPDYGIGIDNVATIYFSIAFREPAPESFTALPDA